MARATPGNYVPLDVNYARDKAVRKAGPDAELLFVRSLAHCKSARTDGLIPEFDLAVVSVGLPRVGKSVAALVAHRLWIEVPDGWIVRSWQSWNASVEDEGSFHDQQSDKGIAGNHKRWHVIRGITDSECPLCQPASRSGDRSSDDPASRAGESPIREGKGREGKELLRNSTSSAQFDRTPDDALTTTDNTVTAQTIVAEWIDHCRERPPGRVIGQLGREIAALIDEGIDPTKVRTATATWAAKGLHPSTLASVVHETMNGTSRRSTTDDRVNQALALAAEYEKAGQ